MLDPEHTLARLESRLGAVPEVLRVEVASLAAQEAARRGRRLYDLDDVLRLGNLTDMTHRLARSYGGFPSLQEYLRGYAVVGEVLGARSAQARTRIISADDDPIIPGGGPRAHRATRGAHGHAHALGGHCGFYDGGRVDLGRARGPRDAGG